jgi:hypothetical protein
MSAIELVVIMLSVIGAAIAMVLVTVGISSLARSHRMRLEPLRAEARQALATALSSQMLHADETLLSLQRFPEHCIVSVMLDLAPSVTGTSRVALHSLGEETGLLGQAKRGVHRRRWSTRLYSARVLTAFGVESDDIVTLQRDRSPEVRAQAAAWTVVAPTAAAIEGLVGLLDDEDGLCRFAAQDALIRIGLPSTEVLISALATADDEVLERILEIAAAVGDDRFYGQALALSKVGSETTRALATTVLARTGHPGAGANLVSLLDDESEVVILAATAGLAKLAYWPAAAEIESLLDHQSWGLRKQAAMTLLALGAPGSILLLAAAPGEGPGAEMATQALQLKSLTEQVEIA